MRGADWKFCHEGNCLISWGLPSDPKQFQLRVTEFSIRTNQPTIMDSFSCIHFLWQLHLSLNKHFFFINLTLEYLHLRPRNVQFASYLKHWHWDVSPKMTSQRYPDVKHYSVWHPPCKMKFPCTGQWCGNSCPVCKKMSTNSTFQIACTFRPR